MKEEKNERKKTKRKHSQCYELRVIGTSYIQRNQPRSPHTCFILFYFSFFVFVQYPHMLTFVQGQMSRLYWCIVYRGTYVLHELLFSLWIELYRIKTSYWKHLYNDCILYMCPREHQTSASMLVTDSNG